ncbi:MAG: four helix bundle protein [Chitinophagales bacterium]|nr:four helix bundle protein [Chitinophagales bacterium]
MPKGLCSLSAYKQATHFSKIIFNIANQLPSVERFRLADQMIRSSRSIAANIAEGYGRFYFQDNIRFCRMARASIFETQFHLQCAFDCNYIDSKIYNNMMNESMHLLRNLSGYIRFLNKRIQQN